MQNEIHLGFFHFSFSETFFVELQIFTKQMIISFCHFIFFSKIVFFFIHTINVVCSHFIHITLLIFVFFVLNICLHFVFTFIYYEFIFIFSFESFQAEKKGCTATEYGFVFGIFELIVFLVSPLYGQFMNRIGPKVLFNSGIYTTGTSAIIFGLLDKVEVNL